MGLSVSSLKVQAPSLQAKLHVFKHQGLGRHEVHDKVPSVGKFMFYLPRPLANSSIGYPIGDPTLQILPTVCTSAS